MPATRLCCCLLFLDQVLERQIHRSNMTSQCNGVELIPGTEMMSDLDSANKTLIPTPSSDPHDPLNWSRKWKRTCHTCFRTPSVPADIVYSLGHGVTVSLHLDLGIGRAIYRPDVSSFGRPIQPLQSAARHAHWHNRDYARLRQFHHRASFQYLRTPRG
jgi:hypothetical protein